jgi:hypothetical protein
MTFTIISEASANNDTTGIRATPANPVHLPRSRAPKTNGTPGTVNDRMVAGVGTAVEGAAMTEAVNDARNEVSRMKGVSKKVARAADAVDSANEHLGASQDAIHK